MTKPDFTLHRERLLALRARLQDDMTQMEDNALNKEHNNTTSMPNHMAELGSDNADQELTLSSPLKMSLLPYVANKNMMSPL
jgi:hypothetical protein